MRFRIWTVVQMYWSSRCEQSTRRYPPSWGCAWR